MPSFPTPTRHTACSRPAITAGDEAFAGCPSACRAPRVRHEAVQRGSIHRLPRAAGSEFEEYLGTKQSESSIVPTTRGFLQWQLGLQPEQPQGHFYTLGNFTLSKGSAAEKEKKKQKTEINYVDVLSCVFAEICGVGWPLLGGRVPPLDRVGCLSVGLGKPTLL